VAVKHATNAGQLVERRRHRLFHRWLVGAGLLARELGDLLRGADAGATTSSPWALIRNSP
jgi:hypothetical protein